MLGLFVELLLSGLLLWLVGQEQLTALGLKPLKSRFLELIIGLLAAGTVCASYHLAATYFAGNRWLLNPRYTASTFVESTGWVLKSVLFETLIFQGALLYIALKKLGISKACGLSAVCFGVYHWFSYGALGKPASMAIIFCMTGLTGLLYAYAFAQTRSLYLPVGLHLGWNLVQLVVFSIGPLGKQLLLLETTAKVHGLLSLALFLFQVFALPVAGYFYLSKRNQPLPSHFSQE